MSTAGRFISFMVGLAAATCLRSSDTGMDAVKPPDQCSKKVRHRTR